MTTKENSEHDCDRSRNRSPRFTNEHKEEEEGEMFKKVKVKSRDPYYDDRTKARVKAREMKTKMVSNSFIDEREISKELLRQSIENQNNFIHKENIDYFKINAFKKINKREQMKEKVKELYKNQPKKIDDYYNKYVK